MLTVHNIIYLTNLFSRQSSYLYYKCKTEITQADWNAYSSSCCCILFYFFFVSKILYESSSEESSGEDAEQEKKGGVLDLEDLGPMMNSMQKAKVINYLNYTVNPYIPSIKVQHTFSLFTMAYGVLMSELIREVGWHIKFDHHTLHQDTTWCIKAYYKCSASFETQPLKQCAEKHRLTAVSVSWYSKC